MAEHKRSAVWSYFTAVNENVVNCDACRKALHGCGSITNSFKHIKKKKGEREHRAAAEKKGGGRKCLISNQTPNLELTGRAFLERQGISRNIE